MERQTDFLFQEPTLSPVWSVCNSVWSVCNSLLMILDVGSSDDATVSLIFAIYNEIRLVWAMQIMFIFTKNISIFGYQMSCTWSISTSPVHFVFPIMWIVKAIISKYGAKSTKVRHFV